MTGRKKLTRKKVAKKLRRMYLQAKSKKFFSSKIVFFAIFCIKKHLHNRLREKKNSNSEHLRDVTGLMNDLRTEKKK